MCHIVIQTVNVQYCVCFSDVNWHLCDCLPDTLLQYRNPYADDYLSKDDWIKYWTWLIAVLLILLCKGLIGPNCLNEIPCIDLREPTVFYCSSILNVCAWDELVFTGVLTCAYTLSNEIYAYLSLLNFSECRTAGRLWRRFHKCSVSSAQAETNAP